MVSRILIALGFDPARALSPDPFFQISQGKVHQLANGFTIAIGPDFQTARSFGKTDWLFVNGIKIIGRKFIKTIMDGEIVHLGLQGHFHHRILRVFDRYNRVVHT
jgi:hypothetical protein